MHRYIDTDTLNWLDDLFMKSKNDSGIWVRYKDVESFIKNAPAADVEEVRYGRWIMQDGYITCNCCGCQPYKNSRNIDFDNLWRRCPDCGAKMDLTEAEK